MVGRKRGEELDRGGHAEGLRVLSDGVPPEEGNFLTFSFFIMVKYT